MEGLEQTSYKPSVLDDLGEEVTGIIAPVSICMAATVLLVRLLNPEGSSGGQSSVIIASIAYDENASDSSSKKFSGALLNAVIFAGIMAAMTFILVLLFKYGCFKFIYAYMAFAVFDIFFLITGIVMIEVITVLDIRIDAFSFMYMLLNFSVVGTIGVLFMPIPLLAKQFYMVWVGVITAYIFTWIPEWTTWVLLGVMAIYDILAVLIPGGPLKMLVEVAIERNQALPALVYEARPARGPYQGADAWVRQRNAQQQQRQQGQDEETGQAMGPPDTQAMSNRVLDTASVDSSVTGSVAPLLAGAPSSTSAPTHPSGSRPVGESIMSGLTAPPSPPILLSASAHPPARAQRKGSVNMSPPLLSSNAQVFPAPMRSPRGSEAPAHISPRSPPSSRASVRMSSDDHELADAAHWGQSPHSLHNPSGAGGRHGSGPGPVGEGVDGANGCVVAVAVASSGLGPVAEGAETDGADPAAHWRALPSGPPPIVAHGSSSRAHGSTSSTRLEGAPSGTGTLRGSSCTGPLSPDHPMGMPMPVLPGSTEQDTGYLPPAGQRVQSGGGGPDDARLGSGSLRALPVSDSQRGEQPPVEGQVNNQNAVEVDEIELPDSIKLGLGDFIFYSMLVGRAAMYDFMTVFASYLGIIAGLGLTLLCLTFYQRALPALPFSIALGVMFYFVTRLSLEPFLVPLVTQLVYF